MSDKRLGFACKWVEQTDKGIESIPDLNTKTTTVAWLNRQPVKTAEQKLWNIMQYNLSCISRILIKLGTMPSTLRMFRLPSDLLPMYSEPTWNYFWQQPEAMAYYEREFSAIGNLARQHQIRLSFHPGQFCCIVSNRLDVVDRSLIEMEYHADMARHMGYGKAYQDMKINVHLSGKLGIDGFAAAYTKMSPELRNCITIENDEYQQNIDAILQLKNVPVVLDLHHQWISNKEFISATDDRIKLITDSWKGVRPVIHYSQSRPEYIGLSDTLPNIIELLSTTTRSKLRAHSDFYVNQRMNDWARSHWEWSDIMLESKSKNLAALELFNEWNHV